MVCKYDNQLWCKGFMAPRPFHDNVQIPDGYINVNNNVNLDIYTTDVNLDVDESWCDAAEVMWVVGKIIFLWLN